MFGEFSAIDGLPRSASVTALTNCLLARMSAAKFFELLRSNGTVSTRLVEALVAKIRQMSERVFEVSALALRERVRRELLRLAVDGTHFGNSVVIRPAPTHYEIAAHRVTPRGRDAANSTGSRKSSCSRSGAVRSGSSISPSSSSMTSLTRHPDARSAGPDNGSRKTPPAGNLI